MLPFEIRDLKFDSTQLITIPQKMGVKQTKILGFLMLLIILILEFFKNEFTLVNTTILVLILVATLAFLLYSKINQGKYYSAFWVEGLPVLWLVLLLIFT